MKKNVAIILSLTLVLLVVVPAASAQSEEKTGTNEVPPAPVIQAEQFTSEHRITIDGRTVEYTATAGTMLMRGDEDEPVALFGYTAYVEKGADAATRPILFAYNGGAGLGLDLAPYGHSRPAARGCRRRRVHASWTISPGRQRAQHS